MRSLLMLLFLTSVLLLAALTVSAADVLNYQGRLTDAAAVVVPDGTTIGVDPVQDRERFYVSENGVTLVTASMLRGPARAGGG